MFRNASRVGLFLLAFGVAGLSHAQTQMDIKQGDAVVSALVMGAGEHAVIALHGRNEGPEMYFKDGSGGNLGTELANAGFRVIAVGWPKAAGTGKPQIAAAIQHAKESGAKKVSLLGLSMGTWPVADYAAAAAEGDLDSVVLMSATTNKEIALAKTKKLFVFSKNDRFARADAPAMAEKSAEPKQVIVLDGSGHLLINDLKKERPSLAQDVIDVLRR